MKPTPEPIHPASGIADWLRKGLLWAGLIILAFFTALLEVIVELFGSAIGIIVGLAAAVIIYWIFAG